MHHGDGEQSDGSGTAGAGVTRSGHDLVTGQSITRDAHHEDRQHDAAPPTAVTISRSQRAVHDRETSSPPLLDATGLRALAVDHVIGHRTISRLGSAAVR